MPNLNQLYPDPAFSAEYKKLISDFHPSASETIPSFIKRLFAAENSSVLEFAVNYLFDKFNKRDRLDKHLSSTRQNFIERSTFNYRVESNMVTFNKKEGLKMLPVSFDDWLSAKSVESSRIEYKKDGIQIRSFVQFILLRMISTT